MPARARAIFVPEMNRGQVAGEMARMPAAVHRPCRSARQRRGDEPDAIVEAIEEMIR